MPDSTAQQQQNTVDAESTVVDGQFPTNPNVRRIGLPRVFIDGRSTWESPCFWFLAGGITFFLGAYIMKRMK